MGPETIAQIIGMFAMAMNCISFQFKKKTQILAFQLCGSTLFAINFFMLGAYSGGLLNAIAVIRAIVYIKEKTFHSKHIAWVFGFSALYVLSYVSVFTVFGTPFEGWKPVVELLPVIAMVLTTVSFRCNDAKAVRFFGMFSSPLWLTYNIICFSVGAIICEVLNFVSLVVAILRYDIKKTSALEKE